MNNAIVTYRYILISQPVKKVLPKKDQPYLILWRDNFDGDARLSCTMETNLSKTFLLVLLAMEFMSGHQVFP
ncbi:hypothetical protein [Nostoc sp.]|uniref:hypothetical protein n=1 Tax=Nostoc sp. TaxID=1180 RepID=UPI002FF98A89